MFESMRVLYQLEQQNAAGNLLLNRDQYITALWLTPDVFPKNAEVVARALEDLQFAISFPVPLRFWFQTNKKLYAHVHKIVIGEIHQYYQNNAKSLGVKDPMHGTIFYPIFPEKCTLQTIA